jgi:surface protein
MFSDCWNLTSLDISNFDMTNVTDINGIFGNCINLTSLNLLDCSSDTVSKIITSSHFPTNIIEGTARTIYCSKENAGELIAPTNWEFDYIEDHLVAIYTVNNIDKTSPTSVTGKADDWEETVVHNKNGTYTVTITASYGPTKISFKNHSNLLSVDYINTSNITDMSDMFYGCIKLTSVNTSNFDTSNVTSMYGMFCACKSLKSLDVSNFDNSNVKSMSYMFSVCDSLTSLDLSSFDTSNVFYMEEMFSFCPNLRSLDLSSFDTSQVTDMSYMFENSSKLRTLHLDNCSNDTIRKIITSSSLPTNAISGATKTIYCKEEEAAGLTVPRNWVFSYVS